MSVSHIKDKTKFILWGMAAGRCQYEGCNAILYQDNVTKAAFNIAYIAHIIADKPRGPRGHSKLSEKLKADLSNLMLLCDKHHRLIDKEDVAGHPAERLHKMKARHEKRIAVQTSLGEDSQSHILLYTANVGQLNAPLSWNDAYSAITPNRYPADIRAIEIGIQNSALRDSDPNFWQFEQAHLQRQVQQKVRERVGHDIFHLSVFGLAPQPLLIELGRLLSDISAVDVYQHQREPEDNWRWEDNQQTTAFRIFRPENDANIVALNLSLSATINDDRIYTMLGENVAIWRLTIDQPYNDFLKSRQQLSEFRKQLRNLFDEIKVKHGQQSILHLFPAAPVAVAIEVGRVWMPKADLPLKIYDQNRKLGGFQFALDVRS